MNEDERLRATLELNSCIQALTESMTRDMTDALEKVELTIRMKKVQEMIARLPIGNGLTIYRTVGEVLEVEWADNQNIMAIYVDTLDVTLIVYDEDKEYKFNLDTGIPDLTRILNGDDRHDGRNLDSERTC